MSNTVINTNVLALNAHRSLKAVGTTQAKTASRLSSGMKINSAADDAAGLAISEKMRAQIRGLDMSSKNSQDAISLIQTAEGGMQEIDNMLQRVRELTVQASNDTNEYNTDGSSDRQKMQDEVSQLVGEIDSMGERVEFNKKKVINGEFSDPKEVLARASANYQSTSDSRGITTGAGTLRDVADAKKALDGVAGSASGSTDIVKDFTTVDTLAKASRTSAGSLAEKLVSAGSSGAALIAALTSLAAASAVVTGVNAITTNTGTGLLDVKTMDDIDKLIGGTTAIVASATSTQADKDAVKGFNEALKLGGDKAREYLQTKNLGSSGALAALKNVVDKATTFFGDRQATVDAWYGSAATANITVKGSTTATKVTSADIATEADYNRAKAAAYSDMAKDQSKLSEAQTADDRLAHKLTKYQGQMNDATAEMAKMGNKPAGLFFQVGANADQKLQISIGSAKSDILGIGDGMGKTNIDLVKASGSQITNILDNLDEALSYVSSERSKLGATQNRLEYTIKSLDVSSENLSASESRIRDTDMAKEMMNSTKANVLQQAATAMLSQANQAPQNVLQLLR